MPALADAVFDPRARKPSLHFLQSVFGGAVIAALCGCGGGGPEAAAPAPAACALASSWDGTVCQPFARRDVDRLATPWSDAGRAQTLELVVYRPLQPPGPSGRYPTLVFHHGSTGNGDDPALFTITFESQSIARTFTARGYQVLFPQRRGRGQSDGVYDEGFVPDRSRYSCIGEHAVPGLRRALEDAAVIAQGIAARGDVDTARLLVGGVSRGGVLAMLHAAQSAGVYRGAINFVGGWLGEGCADAVEVNRGAFEAAATGPDSLWLYGANDPFYGVAHSEANFAAFVAGGGRGRWLLLHRTDPSASGHAVHTEPALWSAALDDFLRQVMPAPPAAGTD